MTTRTIKQLQDAIKMRAEDYFLRVQVPGDGNIDATYAIIGEGPGQEEVNKEMPMVGTSGRLLWNSLRSQNMLRPQFYITNVCKRQISLHKNTRHPVSAEEWIKWQHLLHWELDQLPNLKFIYCLGNAGIQALFGWKGITKFRGSVYDWQGKTVVVGFNPAAVLRVPKDEVIFHMDTRTFAKVTRGDWKPYHITPHINPTFAQATDFVAGLIDSPKPVSYDIETISGETACFGVGNDPHEAMCIPLRNRYTNHFTLDEEYTLRLQMQELFEKQRIIAHNGNFDAHWTWYKDNIKGEFWFDTMLAHHTLYPILPHGLDFLVSQYTTHPYYKDELATFKEGGDIDGFWEYNCRDVALTYACHEKLHQELNDQHLDQFYFQHVQRLDKHLIQSTVEGVLVDQKVKEQVAAELLAETDLAATEVVAMARKELDLGEWYAPNLNSNPQMQDLFLNKLGLRSPTGKFDKPARERILGDSRTNPSAAAIVVKYNEYQSKYKLLSTYANAKIDPDNRIRYAYKQHGVVAAPGRLSSSSTLWGVGMNMQNQPEATHKFYIADDGTVMFYFDLAQAEARVVAVLAWIEKWLEDFERARLNPGAFDAHISLAADMYGVPYDQVPKKDIIDGEFTQRYKAKRARHGLNYTMQWPRLAEAAQLSPYEAKRTYILYHKTNPEIQTWWNDTVAVAKNKKELWTPMGRRIRIQQRIDDQMLGNLVAMVPQSTIGDKVKQVWYQCHEDPEWDMNKARIKLNIHDALIGIATPDFVKTALRIAKKYAESPILIQNTKGTHSQELIIPADCKISEADEDGKHRWSTLKNVDI